MMRIMSNYKPIIYAVLSFILSLAYCLGIPFFGLILSEVMFVVMSGPD